MKDSNCGNYVPTANSRRDFLRQTGLGMGTLALGTMMSEYMVSDAHAEVMANLKPRKAPLAAKAKAAAAVTTKASPEVKIETSVQGGKIVNNTEKVDRKVPSNPWVMLAQSMVCSNEFVYLN